MKPELETIKMPAGKYAISDPCYLFEHDEWDKLLERHGTFAGDTLFIEKRDGKEYHMAISGTAYGDGYYESDLPGSPCFGVDAGMIGAIPVELVSTEILQSGKSSNALGKAYIHEFKGEWEFTPCDNQGVIRFGDTGAIQTGSMDFLAEGEDDERDELEEKIASEMEKLAIGLWESVVDKSLMEEAGDAALALQSVLAALIANARDRAGLPMEGLLEFDREEEMAKAAEFTWHHFLTLRNLDNNAGLDQQFHADLCNQLAHGIWVIAVNDWDNAQDPEELGSATARLQSDQNRKDA